MLATIGTTSLHIWLSKKTIYPIHLVHKFFIIPVVVLLLHFQPKKCLSRPGAQNPFPWLTIASTWPKNPSKLAGAESGMCGPRKGYALPVSWRRDAPLFPGVSHILSEAR